LSQFSVFTQPPKEGVMAVISDVLAKGWFDDSQSTGEVWVLGGYMGSPIHWEVFDTYWPMALANSEVPYFHMREMADPKGPFAKWLPHADHRQEVDNFFSDMTKVISHANLHGFVCAVRLKDLARFNAETGLNLEPYPLAAYGCMLLVGKDYTGKPVEMVFDHVEKIKSKLAKAQEYADSDRYYGPDGVFSKVAMTGLPEEITFRDIPALQAADFWAWEYRKSHLRLNEWWSLEDRPQDWGDEQWSHMDSWFKAKHGSWEAGTRKSLQALLTRPNFTPMIWSYQELCEAHKVRGGVWA
jgi:hypothetical protein